MSREEVVALWRRYGRLRRVEDRNRLVEHYFYVAKSAADRMFRLVPNHIDREELLSYAAAALLGCVERFDPTTGTRFATYASARCKGAIQDALRDSDWVPRMVREAVRRGEIPRESVAHMFRFSAVERHVRGDNPDADPLPFEDQDSGRGFARIDAADEARHALRMLTDREREILRLYDALDIPMQQVGAYLGISESRVSQLRKGALAKLRRAAQGADGARPERRPAPGA